MSPISRISNIFNIFIQTTPEPYSKYAIFIPHFLIMLLVVLLLTPIIGAIAKKYNIIDNPLRRRKLNPYDDPARHTLTTTKLNTPLIGSLAVLIPLTIYLLFMPGNNHILLPITFAIILLTVMSVLDDIFNLPAHIQFIIQLIAAIIIALSPINLTDISNPFNGNLNLNLFTINPFPHLINLQLVFPGDILLIGWVLICTNAIRWVSGEDGIMEGNLTISFFLLFLISVRSALPEIASLNILLTGGLLGFLFYNYYPAKIRSGNGKTVYGFLIAILAILNKAKLATSIIILAFPLVDFAFVIIKRIMTKKPKSLLELLRMNDRNHIHHQLLDIGKSPQEVFMIETSITLLVGMVAVLTTGTIKYFALLGVFFLLTIFISFIHILKNKKVLNETNKQEKKDSPESRYSY